MSTTTTIGDVTSRLRNLVKSVKQDAFLTDRFLYSLVLKHAQLLIRRQDSANKLMKFSPVWQVLAPVELIEVDKVEAQCNCLGILSGCTFKRTKHRLPRTWDGYWGPLIRSVSSIDGSREVEPVNRPSFETMRTQKTFKYNNTKYYWYIDGYLYFPDLHWDFVRIEGLFEEDIEGFACDEPLCKSRQESPFNIPEGLHAEIEELVARDLGVSMNIPTDPHHDNKHTLR